MREGGKGGGRRGRETPKRPVPAQWAVGRRGWHERKRRLVLRQPPAAGASVRAPSGVDASAQVAASVPHRPREHSRFWGPSRHPRRRSSAAAGALECDETEVERGGGGGGSKMGRLCPPCPHEATGPSQLGRLSPSAGRVQVGLLRQRGSGGPPLPPALLQAGVGCGHGDVPTPHRHTFRIGRVWRSGRARSWHLRNAPTTAGTHSQDIVRVP